MPTSCAVTLPYKFDNLTHKAWLIIEPITNAANISERVPRPFATPESNEFSSSIIKYIAAKGSPAVIKAMASVIMPYKITKVTNARLAKTSF